MKDKNNLLNHNQWSCTEYYNSFDSFSKGANSEITNKYTTIGENSIVINKNNMEYYWIDVPFPNITITGTYNIKIDILTQFADALIRVYDSQFQSTITQLWVPKNINFNTISISTELLDSTESYRIRIRNNNEIGTRVFIDNLSCNKS